MKHKPLSAKASDPRPVLLIAPALHRPTLAAARHACDVTVSAHTAARPVLLIVMHRPYTAAASQLAGWSGPTCTHFVEK